MRNTFGARRLTIWQDFKVEAQTGGPYGITVGFCFINNNYDKLNNKGWRMSSPAQAPEEETLVKRGKGPKYGKRDIQIGQGSQILGDNSIRTSKYRIWNFFILNLFEQFKKPANVYFLVALSDLGINLHAGYSRYIDIRWFTDNRFTINVRHFGQYAKRLSRKLQTSQFRQSRKQ